LSSQGFCPNGYWNSKKLALFKSKSFFEKREIENEEGLQKRLDEPALMYVKDR
jgi:hypothetical protein